MHKDMPAQNPQAKYLAGFCYVALGIGCAMAFMVDPQGYVGKSAVPASSTSLLWTMLGAVFAWLFSRVHKARLFRPVHMVFGLLFGVLNYFGTTLFAYDTWGFLHTPLAWSRAGLQWMGQGFPMAAFLALVDGWLREGRLTCAFKNKISFAPWLANAYAKHPLLCSMGFFWLCWSPYLLVFFPGSLSWDMGEMAAQFFGLRQLNTWHPVFLTWVLGSFLWLGKLFASDTLGLALFTLLQTVALAFALGQVMVFLRRMGANFWAQAIALVFFALTPIWGAYAQFICKDTLYTALLLLFTLQTLELLKRECKRTAGFWIAYGLYALLACLVRSNGLYVILPTGLLLVGVGLKGKQRLRAGMALGGAVLCALLFSEVLMPLLHIPDEAEGGIYSVPFQQSARALRDHGEQITPEEYAGIDRVLAAENLPGIYEPWISDPVKYTFKQYGQSQAVKKEALEAYRKTWLSMLKKYPATYLEAFVAGNSAYYTFTPKMEGETFNNQAGNRFVFETHPQVATNLDVHVNYLPLMEKPQILLAAFARGWRHVPFLSLLYVCAAYTWLLVGAGISLGRRGCWRELLGFVPALLSLGVCMLSPVNDYFRYFLPIVAMCVPLLVFADGKSPS